MSRTHPLHVAFRPVMLRSKQMPLYYQVRLGEKEALDSTLRFFEDRALRLDALEYYQERRLKNLGLMDDNGGSTYNDFFKDGVA